MRLVAGYEIENLHVPTGPGASCNNVFRLSRFLFNYLFLGGGGINVRFWCAFIRLSLFSFWYLDCVSFFNSRIHNIFIRCSTIKQFGLPSIVNESSLKFLAKKPWNIADLPQQPTRCVCYTVLSTLYYTASW